MTFIDLFSGIGGFRIGLEQAGHKCLGHCEYDKFANWSYIAMHQLTISELETLQDMPIKLKKNGEPNLKKQQKYIQTLQKGRGWYAEDIRTVRADDIPLTDCWCFGFPCQDISVAGQQVGFSGERSSLFFTVTGLIKQQKEEDKPSYLFIENVKNLLSVNKGWDFTAMLVELDEIGYDAEWSVINSADVVAQNRERIFIIGHLRGRSTAKVFPIEGTSGETNTENVKQIGRAKSDKRDNPNQYRVYAADGIAPRLSKMDGGGRQPHIAIPVLTPDRAEKRQNGRRFKENSEPMFTLTGQDKHGVLLCKLDKTYIDGKFTSIGNAKIKDIGAATASALTARYYKGISGHNDNMVMMYQRGRGNNKGGLNEVCPTLTKNSFEQNNFVIIPDFITTPTDKTRTLRKGGQSSLEPKHSWDIIFDRVAIRRLTPRECFRLQTFSDEMFDKASLVNSDSQLYKQAGNSVTVEVIRRIAERMRVENEMD